MSLLLDQMKAKVVTGEDETTTAFTAPICDVSYGGKTEPITVTLTSGITYAPLCFRTYTAIISIVWGIYVVADNTKNLS